MTIYLVNYNDDDDLMVVVDGKPKMVGPKKTETIPVSGDVTMRVSRYAKDKILITVSYIGG